VMTKTLAGSMELFGKQLDIKTSIQKHKEIKDAYI
jgi:hypothetical protein